MKNFFQVVFLVSLVTCVISFPYPISQPVYGNNQLLSAKVIPQIQYKQPEAPGYIQPQYVRQQVIQPVYESRGREGLTHFATQAQQTQDVPEKQVNYRQQAPQVQIQYIQPSQLASQAREALAVAQNQRKYAPQPQHQPQQYVVEQQPRVQYVTKQTEVKLRPQRIRQNEPEQDGRKEEDYDPNPSYQFGFDVRDDLYTNYQNRKEQRDGNKITGSYSVVDSDGYIRTVSYTADPKEGFKAEVSREPTDIVVKTPKPLPQYQSVQKQRPQYVQEVPSKRVQADPRQQPNIVYRYQ